MARRFDLGRALLVLGAALLIVSLFLRWYDTGPTGWQVFETLDLVLAALALAAVALALTPAVAPRWAVLGVPGAALAIVVVQIVNTPPAAAGGQPTTGVWLALGGAALMGAGTALALARISITVRVDERELRPRVAAVDRRETPAAATTAAPAADPVDDDLEAGDELERTQQFSALPEDELDEPAGPEPPERP